MDSEFENERARILQMIEDGLISVDEGIELIKALDGRVSAKLENQPAQVDEFALFSARFEAGGVPLEPKAVSDSSYSQEAAAEEHSPQPKECPESETPQPNFAKWRGWWWIPMWVGVGITVISAGLMYLAWQKSGLGFWFACTWFPFALGILVMALSWASRTARWLHVRIHQKPGESPQHIAISLPLPIRLTAWFVRTFRDRIPGLEFSGLDEVILALQHTNPDAPFYVEVNEGENGERVEVYIG